MPNRHDKTLTQILIKLASFLPPDDAVAIIHQIKRAIPLDLSGGVFVDESPKVTDFDDVTEATFTPTSSIATQFDALQEMYPARAASLYLRVLLHIIANLFEQRALHTLDDAVLNLLIDGLLHSEAILDARCVNCPKTSVLLQ